MTKHTTTDAVQDIVNIAGRNSVSVVFTVPDDKYFILTDLAGPGVTHCCQIEILEVLDSKESVKLAKTSQTYNSDVGILFQPGSQVLVKASDTYLITGYLKRRALSNK